jgi:hypothetical protein
MRGDNSKLPANISPHLLIKKITQNKILKIIKIRLILVKTKAEGLPTSHKAHQALAVPVLALVHLPAAL